MEHFFYAYSVYIDDEGVEHTLLKWKKDGIWNKIDKPTSQLTGEDLNTLKIFEGTGRNVQDKKILGQSADFGNDFATQ